MEYKIEPIATFLDHQCVNVVEKILKDPTHPITQKQTVKRHHNTRSSQHIPATAKTKTYQNSCLQKALGIKRDGYVNKYTNPRKAETTTPEYITVIQDLKQQAKKKLKIRLQNKQHKSTNYRIIHYSTSTNYSIDRTIKIFPLANLFIYYLYFLKECNLP